MRRLIISGFFLALPVVSGCENGQSETQGATPVTNYTAKPGEVTSGGPGNPISPDRTAIILDGRVIGYRGP